MEDKKDNTTEEQGIDLLALGHKLWLSKWFISKVLAIAFIVGLIVAFSIPKEYITTIVLTPESQSTGGGAMGSLAALAGVNLSNSATGDALASPDLYPDILQSTPFLKGLFDINVKDTKGEIDTTLYSYMNDYQSEAWWSHIFKAPGLLMGLFSSAKEDLEDENNANSRVLSKEEMGVIESLKNSFDIAAERKTGIVKISVTMQSPEISAYLADTITSYLQSYIIDYRTQKARLDLQYAEKLYQESKENYHKTQSSLATYMDGNMNVVSARFRTTQERLQNEANLAFSIYNQTAQQLQMAKIKVQDTTPVFMVIQPAVQPIVPLKPSKKMVLIVFLFLAAVGASAWLLRKDVWEILNNKDDDKD